MDAGVGSAAAWALSVDVETEVESSASRTTPASIETVRIGTSTRQVNPGGLSPNCRNLWKTGPSPITLPSSTDGTDQRRLGPPSWHAGAAGAESARAAAPARLRHRRTSSDRLR